MELLDERVTRGQESPFLQEQERDQVGHGGEYT